ncbi:MAG: FtsX-like permease family protein [Anaerolineae bacterium]|jgi:putative ABC transport system permease protein
MVLDVILLALHELRRHRARTLIACLALALASGLVVATGSLGMLLRTMAEPVAPLVGRPADFWIVSAYDADYDLPAGTVERVARADGVATAQAVVRRPVVVGLPGGREEVDSLALIGTDLSAYLALHRLELAAGSLAAPEEPGLLVLSPWAYVHQVRPGDVLSITVPGGEVVLPVAGLIEVRDLAATQQGFALYAPREVVARWFGIADAITLVEVWLAPAASPSRVRASLEEALGPAYAISTTAQRGAGVWRRLVMGALVVVVGLALLGAAVLVYAAFASSAPERARRVALLRAIGATRGVVLALLAAEAALAGLAGGVVGLAVGALLAHAGARFVASQAGPAPVPLPTAWFAAALLLSLAAALAGAVWPALRAARRPPVRALVPAVVPAVKETRMGWPVLARLGRRLPGALPLAAANLARDARRAFLLAAALAVVLAMFLGSIGVLSLVDHKIVAALGRLSGGDFLLLPDVAVLSLDELSGQDTSTVPPLGPGLLAALDDLEDEVRTMAGTTADVDALQLFPGQPTVVLDVEGYAHMGGFRFIQGSWADALAAFRRGPAVLLVPPVARRLDAGVGDTIVLQTPQGPVAFVVAGVGDSEFTTCILDLADGAAYLGVNEVNGVMVQVRPGADAAAVRRSLLAAIRAHGGTLLPLDAATAQLQAAFRQARLASGVLVALSGVVALLGVVSVSLSSIAERREEIGLLRAVGAARSDVAWMVLAEAGMIGAAAAAAGTLLGWAVTLAFAMVARAHLGLGGVTPDAWAALLGATVVAWVLWPAAAMLAALAAALHAARRPILEALYETP